MPRVGDRAHLRLESQPGARFPQEIGVQADAERHGRTAVRRAEREVETIRAEHELLRQVVGEDVASMMVDAAEARLRPQLHRSEERRVGKAGGSTCGFRWSP